jgi:hypothetical protein
MQLPELSIHIVLHIIFYPYIHTKMLLLGAKQWLQ